MIEIKIRTNGKRETVTPEELARRIKLLEFDIKRLEIDLRNINDPETLKFAENRLAELKRELDLLNAARSALGGGGMMFRAFAIVLLPLLLTSVAAAEKACEDKSVYYSYNGSVTKELYIGGYIHFPKTIADRIKVRGGAVELEDETGWKIRVNSNTVIIEYVKLTDRDFNYAKRTFKAKEYPAELFKPVSPDEMRITLLNLRSDLRNFTSELDELKVQVKGVAEKPTAGEQLMGFLLYFPPMWIVYAILGILVILAVAGWWYERN